MASYMSKPADYGNYTQPINLDLVNFVMQSKQQKYDYNLAKLESKISDELGSIDLARTEDKEYFLNRANETLGSVGNIGSIDFSSSANTKQLDNKINSIVDDRVLNDVISTSNYRSFQSTIQQKQKEDPDLYSPTNVAYAMEKQGVNAWLNGVDSKGNKKDSLGQISYEDYVDVGAELKDISENLDKHANVVKESRPEGLYFKSVEGEYLSAEEVQQIARQQLSSKAKRQMQINGWAHYDGGNAEAQAALKKSFQGYADSRIKNIDNIINKKKLELKSLGSGSPELKAQMQDQISQYEDNKRQTKEAYSSWIKTGNLDSMSSTLEQANVLESFGNTFAFDNRGVSYSTNQVALSLQKLQMTAALKKQEGAVAGVEGSQVKELFGVAKDRDELANTLKQSKDWGNKFNQAVNSEFNKLEIAEQEAIMADYVESPSKTKEEFIFEKLEALPGEGVVDKVTINQLDELRLQKDNYEGAYSKAISSGVEFAESNNIESVVKEYYDNRGVEMLDDKGNLTSVADYLKSKGISADNGILLNDESNKEVKAQILKHYYADKILSKGNFEGFQEKFDNLRLSIADKLSSIGVNAFGSDSQENADRINALKSKTYDASEEDSIMMKRLIDLTGSVEGADTYIKQVKEKGAYDSNQFVDGLTEGIGFGNLLNRDNSVSDDTTLNKWIELDAVKDQARKYLNEESFRGGKRQQGILIPLKSEVGLAVNNTVSVSGMTIDGGVSQFATNTDAGGILIYEDTPDTVTISGKRKTKDGYVPHEVRMLKANLPDEIKNSVDFQTDRSIFDKTNMKPVESSVSFKQTSNRRAYLDAVYFTGSQEAALSMTKDGLIQNLFSYYPEVMGSKVQPTPYASAISSMLDSSNIFVKIEKENDGEFYTKIVSRDLKNGVDTDLYSNLNPIPEESYDESYRKTKRVPQLYVSQFIEAMIKQAQADPENPSDAMVNILKLYGR